MYDAQRERAGLLSYLAQPSEQTRDLQQQVDLGEVVRKGTDLAAVESAHDRPKTLAQITWIAQVKPTIVDHTAGGLDEKAPGPGGEVEDGPLVPLVTLDPEDSLGSGEPGAVEHEPDHRTRGVELAESVTVDLIDVGLVQSAEHVRSQARERKRHERVEHVRQGLITWPKPVVVVVLAEQPAVARTAALKGLVEHALEVAPMRS